MLLRTFYQDPSWQKSTSVDKQVASLWSDGKYGVGVYAFSSVGGIELMFEDDGFKKFIQDGKFMLIVGAESITNPNAIKRLREYRKRYRNLEVKAYICDNMQGIFHPKYCWLKNKLPNKGKIWFSSANLTLNAFRMNKEGSLLITDVPDDQMENVRCEWMDWYTNAEPYLYDINDDNLLDKVEDRCERERKTFERVRDAVKHTESKLTAADKEKLAEILSNMQDAMDDAYWYFDSASLILMAEIPKGGNRWQQCNFSEDVFVHYFGAEKGVNGTYKITLRCVHSDGSLGKLELRPSVSVKSKNYRFEIDDAKGYDYPDDGNRPIVVFARIGGQQFLYELLMPSNKSYKCIKAFIEMKRADSRQRQGKNSCYREVYLCQDIMKQIKDMGLMKRMKK